MSRNYQQCKKNIQRQVRGGLQKAALKGKSKMGEMYLLRKTLEAIWIKIHKIANKMQYETVFSG